MVLETGKASEAVVKIVSLLKKGAALATALF